MTYCIIQAMKECEEKYTDADPHWITEGEQVIHFFLNQPASRPTDHGETAHCFWFKYGELYGKDDFKKITPDVWTRDALTHIKNIGDNYWGSYLLIIYNKLTHCTIVLADPCGQLPLFYCLARPGEIHLTTRPDDFFASGNIQRVKNTHLIDWHLLHGSSRAGDTGWNGIKQLVPGYALQIDAAGNCQHTLFWSALQIPAVDPHTDCISLLANMMAAQLSPAIPLCLELSGGVESTALAIALHQRGLTGNLRAVTYYDPQRRSSNEVAIAQQVTQRLGLRHEIFPLLDHLPFTPVNTIPADLCKPATALCFLALSQGQAQAGLPEREGEIISGQGGDALFMAPPPFGVSVDCLSRGAFFNALQALHDIAVTYRIPYWIALKENILAIVKSAHSAMQNQPMTCLNTALLAERIEGQPLQLRDRLTLLFNPAKRAQLLSFAASLDDINVQVRPYNKRAILPFMGQPMVELALSTPIDQLFNAYFNRITIRNSAYRHHNLSNIWRLDKGDTTHVTLSGIAHNQQHIKEICLNGYCKNEQIINEKKFTTLLNRAIAGYSEGLYEITRIYASEIFLLS